MNSSASLTLLADFSFLEDWEDKYAYIIDLGKKLPPFPESDKTAGNLVKGCTAQVWMTAAQADPGNISFHADSDAIIVRGLIAILMTIYNHQPKDVVRDFDIEEFFQKLGLGDHLSPNRRSGFFAMVGRIRALAG
jgi:cysteine desulfuration protein SufE